MSLELDVLRSERAIESVSLLASVHEMPVPPGFECCAFDRLVDREPLASVAAGAVAQPFAYPGWSVRVRGVATGAHRLFHVERRYAGSFVVPLAEFVANGKRRSGGGERRWRGCAR